MKKLEKLKKKINRYLFDHYKTKAFLDNLRMLFLCILAGAIFGVGYSCFVMPVSDESITIVTGGVSGITQNIVLILKILNVKNFNAATVQSILYFCINIPILTFAFFCVGKKFAIYTLINVIVTSLLIQILPNVELFQNISKLMADSLMSADDPQFNGLILRIFFAAVCTGGSSAVAFRGGSSCGGIDVFSYYFSLRKSDGAGKYGIFINAFIVLMHTILMIINMPYRADIAIISALLAITYLVICALVVDLINVRNKKVQIQFVTDKESLSTVLISNFTHSATVIKGVGAYSKKDKYNIYMVVSSREVKEVVKLARMVDPHVFISVSSLIQVYGNFFIKPVE